MVDKNLVLERIDTQFILTLLSELGEYPFRTDDSKGEIWFKTICHGGDSHKLCYFESSKNFYCYTSCGSMSIFNLIMNLKSLTFIEALDFLSNRVGLSGRKGFNNHLVSNEFTKEIATITKYKNMRMHSTKTPLKILTNIENNNIINYFEDDVFYTGWIKEGISIETMQTFNIRWYESKKAIIIPHYDENGNLIGIRRRSLLEEDQKSSKYMPLILEGNTYTHPLNFNFYGLNTNLKTIKRLKKAVIVESEKSVLLAYEFYKENTFVIATCGFNLSSWHIQTLLNLGVEEVILGFDKDFNISHFEEMEDERGLEFNKFKAYRHRIQSLANKLTTSFRTYVLWDRYNKLDLKDSPFDKGKETLEFLMERKVEITTESED